MKRIAILGSTGSIGESTLKVVRHLSQDLCVTALAARGNIDLLEQQVREFRPRLVAVYDEEKASALQKRLPGVEVLKGIEGIASLAAQAPADMVVSAMSGTLGLIPTVAAIRSGKHVALANKEALISGGGLIMKLAKENGVNLIPIDSEHSAIFQCLKGEKTSEVQRLILTASGGPFRHFTKEQLQQVTVEQALRHPTWNMGPKVTVDCSTLMNKGLEMIEAHWLFGLPVEQIEVVIHPQSIIHSMVEFVDNSIMAQMCEPSMIVPIQYALLYPERKKGLFPPFDFLKNHTLQFYAPDVERFRCLHLAYQAAGTGGSLACYMNAANEVLVNRFVEKQIGWYDIATKLENLMQKHQVQEMHSLDDVLSMDNQARQDAKMI